MYNIFFTVNCVEQLTFYKTFVDQLQFEQLIFFCLKVKLLKIHVRQMIFDFPQVFTFFVNCSTQCRAVDIFVSTSFFELSNFKQLIISPKIWNMKHYFLKGFKILKPKFIFVTVSNFVFIIEKLFSRLRLSKASNDPREERPIIISSS
jgi:hypothetical protein